MLKLKLQYFGPPNTKSCLIRKEPDAAKIEGRRRRGRQRTRWLDGITNSMDMRLSKVQEMLKDRKPGVLLSMSHKESDTTEQMNNDSPAKAYSNQV